MCFFYLKIASYSNIYRICEQKILCSFCSLYRREKKYIHVIYKVVLFYKSEAKREKRKCMLTVQVLGSANPDFYPMSFPSPQRPGVTSCSTSARCAYTHSDMCSCVHILKHTTHTPKSWGSLGLQVFFHIYISWGWADGHGELAGDWL